MSRPIAISLSPNTEKDDIVLAIKTLLSPWIWGSKNKVHELEVSFGKYFGKGYKAIATNSGRSSLFIILQGLGINKGDEVLLQGFTCVAVPNSIRWVGATPVYVDISDDFNFNFADLKRKITPRTKAIIIQNTFGIPGRINEIVKWAKKHKLYIIEDCAHSLGAKYNNQKLGTFGDIAFFSFGRDKTISSVFGGMILVKNIKLYRKCLILVNTLKKPKISWTLQQLLHPILFTLIIPTYNFILGKILLVVFQKLGILSKAVYYEEKFGEKPVVFPAKMPGALAYLALKQFGKLNRFNSHRQKITRLYYSLLNNTSFQLPPNKQGAIWLRFPIRHEAAGDLLKFMRKRGVLLGDWYKGVIMPVKKTKIVNYQTGQCKTAETYSGEIINLPTYPSLTMKDARYIVKLINEWEIT